MFMPPQPFLPPRAWVPAPRPGSAPDRSPTVKATPVGWRISPPSTSARRGAAHVQLAERLQRNPREWQDRAGRTIIVLGDRLPVTVRDTALATACGTLLVGYGSTETGSIASGDSALIDRHPGAFGFVRDGATVEIGDAR